MAVFVLSVTQCNVYITGMHQILPSQTPSVLIDDLSVHCKTSGSGIDVAVCNIPRHDNRQEHLQVRCLSACASPRQFIFISC